MIEQLRTLVQIESHSHDAEGLARMADALRALFAPLGTVTAHAVGPNGASHPQVDIAGRDPGPHLAVLCHYDTVWPRGTLQRMPFAVDERGVARGPGVFDMKGGIVALHAALAELRALSWPPRRALRLL